MSFLDFMEEKTISPEELQQKAWSIPWYKSGFEHGLHIAIEMMCSLAQTKTLKKEEHFREFERLLMEKRHFLMDQCLYHSFSYSGFIRWNKEQKKLEWYQPLSKGEAWDILTTAMEINNNGQKEKDRN